MKFADFLKECLMFPKIIFFWFILLFEVTIKQLLLITCSSLSDATSYRDYVLSMKTPIELEWSFFFFFQNTSFCFFWRSKWFSKKYFPWKCFSKFQKSSWGWKRINFLLEKFRNVPDIFSTYIVHYGVSSSKLYSVAM